jgi:hypothetical protein
MPVSKPELEFVTMEVAVIAVPMAMAAVGERRSSADHRQADQGSGGKGKHLLHGNLLHVIGATIASNTHTLMVLGIKRCALAHILRELYFFFSSQRNIGEASAQHLMKQFSI